MPGRIKMLFLLMFVHGLSYQLMGAVEIEEVVTKLPVTVSRGADLKLLDDVLLYTEVEHLIFTIPDIPDPPSISSKSCSLSEDDEACSLYHGLQTSIKDISQLLAVVNRILTTKGLKDVSPSVLEIPKGWLQPITGVNVASNQPNAEIITAAGEDWFQDTEARLTLRKLLTEGTKSLSNREKRWVTSIIKPALRLAGGALGGDASDIFKKLFVGENSILSYLTSFRAFSKKEYQVFANLPKKVSELEVESKRLLLEILNSTELVKSISKDIQHDIKSHEFKIATIEEAFLLEQYTLADTLRSLYTSIVYSTHFAAYDECRTSQIPIAFVPQQLFHERLLQVEKALPENIRFAIPVDQFQRYYRLALSECVWDSSGGIIRVSVPLVEKEAKFQLYQFKPLQFGHEDMTCAVQTQSSFIIKDLKTNDIFTVTEVDEDQCHPTSTGLCKIPLAAADDSISFCLSVLLGGEPASVLKETCALQCYRDKRPKVSQITESTFVGVHLPKTGVKVVCPTEELLLTEKVEHGAVRFTVGCHCKILVGNRTLAKSSLKSCDPNVSPKVDAIIPVQMTIFDDLLPFSSDGFDRTVFSNADEVYDRKFTPVPPKTVDATETPFRISTFSYNLMQTLFMGYLYFRLNAVAGTLLALNNLPGVHASNGNRCELPNDLYIMLFIIMGLCLLLVLPLAFRRVYNMCKRFYQEQVLMQAHRLAVQEPV